jgi:glycosyltransferase involved in cell wall biosynthesis
MESKNSERCTKAMLHGFKVEKIDYNKLRSLKTSVVLPTFRKKAKFKLLYECLYHQTVKPTELVIADYLHEYHKDYIKELSELYNIPTVHVSRSIGNSHGLNTGVINSSGDFILIANDCTYYPDRWLEKHLMICANNFLSLGSRYFAYSLDFLVEKYLTGEVEIPETYDKITQDEIEKFSHGIKDYLHIKFGDYKIASPQDFRLIGMPAEALTANNVLFEALPGWSYGGNMAMTIEMFLEVNGFDEEYDKGYGWIDCDLGVRLFNKHYKSFINPSNWYLEIQDKEHDESPDVKDKTNCEHNWKLYEDSCSQIKTWVNPTRNLREERNKILRERNEKV